MENHTLNEKDLNFLKAYLDSEEKRKEFIRMYMFILAPGMADGITESNNSINIEESLISIQEKINTLSLQRKNNKETILPLSFFNELENIKESITCLGNSIEEKL